MLPPGRCAWIPPGRPIPCAPVDTLLDGRSTCVRLCCDSLPIEPAILSLSSLLSEIVFRISEWKQNPPTPKFRQHLLCLDDNVHFSPR